MLVGRTDELRRLDDRVTDAIDGSGGAVLVMGEPGAGVTSVLDAVARRSAPRARVVRARAYAGSAAAALLHDLARSAAADASDVDAVVDALRDPGTAGALVLLVDDADRADPSALEVLAEVVARVPGLLAVVGWRQRLGGVPEVLAGWDRLVLPPLDPEAALAVARAGLGRDAARCGGLMPRLRAGGGQESTDFLDVQLEKS